MWCLGFWGPGFTWTPKVGKIIAFRAVIMGLGPLFCILFGFMWLAFRAAIMGLGLLFYRLLGFRYVVIQTMVPEWITFRLGHGSVGQKGPKSQKP